MRKLYYNLVDIITVDMICCFEERVSDLVMYIYSIGLVINLGFFMVGLVLSWGYMRGYMF